MLSTCAYSANYTLCRIHRTCTLYMFKMFIFLFWLCGLLTFLQASIATSHQQQEGNTQSPSSLPSDDSSSSSFQSRNTWAVIVNASRYYYNYRHAADALSFYRIVKRLGVPDNQVMIVPKLKRNLLGGHLIEERYPTNCVFIEHSLLSSFDIIGPYLYLTLYMEEFVRMATHSFTS